MYVANTGSGTVSVINTATGQRDRRQPEHLLDGHLGGFLAQRAGAQPRRQRLYVANTGSNTVSVINTATYQRIDANPSKPSMDISVGSSPSALALGPDGRLYVANPAATPCR